ncbi:MAG TPA: aldo/keto reductase family protein [Fimbriimonadaceae bacterium]|nr:aldo/keto reductase family protein [Fimbriimonadaceae bacterium]
MKYRKLGRYGVRVSEVALGGWLTHGRTLDDATTTQLVHRAFDLGINFFDTADVYNAGEAEKSLAVAIQELRREDLVIGTKCYFQMSDRPNDRGLSRKHIHESVHNSLKRLQTDYVDMMQFHRLDLDTPIDETIRAIEDLIRQGKVLYWGTSEWPAHKLTEAVLTARELNANPPASNQPNYSMLQRKIEEAVLPVSEQYGIGNVVFSPLAQGVLSGKYLPGKAAPAGSRGADEKSNMFMGGVLQETVLERVQQLKQYVEESGLKLPQFSLAWCLRQPAVSSVIVGATSVLQLEENAGASDIAVDSSMWERAEKILAGEPAE